MRFRVAFLLLHGLLLGCATLALAQGSAQQSECADCHDDVVATFQKTAHAIVPGWDPVTGCQSCHGSGDAHIDAGGDPDEIIRLQLLSPRKSSAICLDCHRQHELHFSAKRAIHRLNDVGCIDCHAPHSSAPQMMPVRGKALCAECHAGIVAEFDLPRTHPLGDGGPECASCHNPHASETLRVSSGPRYDQACGQCHFETIGPFIYNHDTMMVDGCMSCHVVHGSANRHLMRHNQQINLCYECHNAAFTPGWHNAAEYVNQKCTSCHTAIHGSNTNPFFLEE